MCYISHWCSTPKRTLYFEHTCSTLSCRKHFKNVVLTSGVVSYHVSGHSTSRVKWASCLEAGAEWYLITRHFLPDWIWSQATMSPLTLLIQSGRWEMSWKQVTLLDPYIAITKVDKRFRNISKKNDPCQQAWFCKSPFTSSLPRSADCERIRGGAQNKSKYPEVHFAVVTITMIFLNWDKLNDLQLLWMRNGPITERTF